MYVYASDKAFFTVAHPDFFGDTGDIWYCRSEENTIRRSIFQSMQSTLRMRGFTLSNRNDTDFKVSSSPFEIKCNKTGNVCQFFAINKDIDRTKAMTPPSGRLKRVMLEEANEPNDKIYVEALRSTALRYMDESFAIPNAITKYYGNVTAQFFFYSACKARRAIEASRVYKARRANKARRAIRARQGPQARKVKRVIRVRRARKVLHSLRR